MQAKIYLKSKNVQYELRNIDENDADMDYVIGRDMRSMPVAVLEDESGNEEGVAFGMDAVQALMGWEKQGKLPVSE